MGNLLFLNAQTQAQIAALNTNPADAQRVMWELQCLYADEAVNPFYDSFIGGTLGSGKAITETANLNIKGGAKLVFPVMTGIGGAGFKGSANLAQGNESQLKGNSYECSTGLLYNAIACNEDAMDLTIIGSEFSQNAARLLNELIVRQKGADLMMAHINVCRNNPNRLLRFQGSAGNREGLRSANTLGWSDVQNIKTQMVNNNAMPMALGTSTTTKAKFSKYMVFGNQHGLEAFRRSGTWADYAKYADTRGDNALFTGDWVDVEGTGVYEWQNGDHTRDDYVGSPYAARALLGTAITAGSTAFNITGGGNPTSAQKANTLYFQWFSNAAYSFIDGVTTIAANTSTQRYVLIQDGTTGFFGMFGYLINSGAALTVNIRLSPVTAGVANATVGHVTWNTGVWAGLHTENLSQGSFIYECNSYGQPFVLVSGMASHMLVCGHGNIGGRSGICDRRINGGADGVSYGQQRGIGAATRWGCAPTYEADGSHRNSLLMEVAFCPPGLPVVV